MEQQIEPFESEDFTSANANDILLNRLNELIGLVNEMNKKISSLSERVYKLEQFKKIGF